MKKTIALLLVLVMCLSLCACGNADTDSSDSTNGEANNPNTSTNNTTEYTTENTTENTTDDRAARYSAAVTKLNALIGDSQEAVSLTEDDAIYLIDEFTALGDYKDSLVILNGFAAYSNMLSRIEKVTSDKIGNQTKEDFRYWYDSKGRLTETTDEKIVAEYGIELSVGYPTLSISYSENGQISEIIVKSYGTITAKGTPIYDEKSNISSIFIIHQYGNMYGEYTSYFEHDGHNRLVTSNVPLGTFGDGNLVAKSYTYSYNLDNLLEKKIATWSYPGGSECSEEIVCFYENGKLVKEEKIYTESATPGFDAKLINTTYSYSYNAEGLVERISISTDNPQITFTSQELIYYYSNLYFYTPQN